ncbi:DUF5655 domain-containing protein [Candidatus Leptofilum sp.]|uniref:DUF5655 domain-containing protein n=1 Tax=Candidatus Leptofilum sp. TaxID=3241576 RepID=UPI003B5A64F2
MTMKSPKDMMTAVSKSLESRTGKTLEAWVAVVQASGIDPLDQKAVRNWLKSEHGILQNSQWTIADAAARAAGWVEPTLEEYIDQQYSGAKAHLRPIFDQLRQIIESFGEDVAVEARSTYIPFVRQRQFMAVAAATKTRVDVGMRFRNAPASDLLKPAKAPGQATHKLSLTAIDNISEEVEKLLRIAYEQNG